MTYFDEFRRHWRPLVAASVGMAFGYNLNNYTNNIFIPHLLKEFGWTSSQIALIGIFVVVGVFTQPFAGRMADRYGARAVAAVGVVAAPSILVAISFLQGSFALFLALTVAQMAIVSSTTNAVVYSGLVARPFNRALGLALALVTCAPSLAGALLVPLLSDYIDANGWRMGYRVAAMVVTVAGGAALLLMSGQREAALQPALAPVRTGRSPADFRVLIRDRAFQLLVIGMVLCNLTAIMLATQLKVVVIGTGIDAVTATRMISIYALSVMFGRLACGVALDRLPSHIVAAVAMGLPGVGLVILAVMPPSPLLAMLAVLAIGTSIGAEGDIAGYLARRYFSPAIYGSIVGYVMGSIAFAACIGSIILSISLAQTGGFTAFLLLSAVAAFVGCSAFAVMGRIPPLTPKPED